MVGGRNPLRQISFSISCVMSTWSYCEESTDFFHYIYIFLITDVSILGCKHLYVDVKASGLKGIVWSRET